VVKIEAALLAGLHFLNRGFQAAPDLHVRPNDGVAILIDDPTAHGAVAFLLRRRRAR
jgi:hypothetical protein